MSACSWREAFCLRYCFVRGKYGYGRFRAAWDAFRRAGNIKKDAIEETRRQGKEILDHIQEALRE